MIERCWQTAEVLGSQLVLHSSESPVGERWFVGLVNPAVDTLCH